MLHQLSPWQPGFWLLVGFALAGITHIATRLAAPELWKPLRWVRWVGVPYVGLLLGGLSPRLLGIAELDWMAGFGIGIGLLFATVVLLLLIRISLHREGSGHQATTVAERSGTPAALFFISGAQEFHWCFLRGAVWDLLLSLPAPPGLPLYWAVWIAAVLGLPGIVLEHRRATDRLITGAVLATTSIMFLYTRNFWLCWLLHGIIQISFQSSRAIGGMRGQSSP